MVDVMATCSIEEKDSEGKSLFSCPGKSWCFKKYTKEVGEVQDKAWLGWSSRHEGV